MGTIVYNDKRGKLLENRSNGQSKSYRGRGIGTEFLSGMYELITKRTPTPEDVMEITILHGTRTSSVWHGKNIGFSNYNSEMEDFVRELKFPYYRENNNLIVFVDDTTRDMYFSFAESLENGRRDGKRYTEGKFFEDVAILTGYPGCCSVCYSKLIDSKRGVEEHPFYSQSKERINKDLGMSLDNLSVEEIIDLIMDEKIYPTRLLISGRALRGSITRLGESEQRTKLLTYERMLPCSIDCEKSNNMFREWERFISQVGDFLYTLGLEVYDILDTIKGRQALADAIRIKGMAKHYKNLN